MARDFAQDPQLVHRAAGDRQQRKQMQTFRMPRGLVAFLKDEAAREERDLTGHVVRLLEGIRGYFGLPEAAVTLLEADRRAMGMGRFEYLLHALFQRSLGVRERGAGFDGPSTTPARHERGTQT
jgi:hypothetical protein